MESLVKAQAARIDSGKIGEVVEGFDVGKKGSDFFNAQNGGKASFILGGLHCGLWIRCRQENKCGHIMYVALISYCSHGSTKEGIRPIIDTVELLGRDEHLERRPPTR